MRTQTAKRRKNRIAREVDTAKQSALCVTLAADDADAIALKRQLEPAVSKGRHLDIDAGAVAALTTAGVQVLLAAAAAAEARHVQFRLTGYRPSIIDLFGELGLADTIASWLDPARNGLTGHVAET
jgi:anti-anti-sigma regulatory factor